MNKIKVHGHDIVPCCNKPDYVDVYILCKPFKGVLCKNCGEVIGVLNHPIVAWLFDKVFSLFWDGRVYIKREDLTPSEYFNLGGCE